MSRLFRGARHFHLPSLSSKITRRVGHGQQVVLHNPTVKRKKYGTWLGRTAFRIFAIIVAVETFDYLVLAPLAKAVESLPEMPVVEEEDDDSPLIIPFPWMTKEAMPPPYARTDPEWREFIRISLDKEQQAHIKSSLDALLLKVASRSRVIETRFGKPTKISMSLLHINYPLYPPPIHLMVGLEITDDYTALKWLERDRLVARIQERVLWPKPVAMGVCALLSAHWSETKAIIYKALFGTSAPASRDPAGLRLPPPPTTASEVQKTIDSIQKTNKDMEKLIQAIRGQATRRPGELPSSETNTDSRMTSSADKPPSTTLASTEAVNTPGSPPNGASNTPPKTPTTTTDEKTKQNPQAPRQVNSFMQEYLKAYSSMPANPPRGSVPVTGQVCIDTPKAWLFVDVVAWWDPKEKDYDTFSTHFSVNHVRHKVINPLR